MSAPRTSPKQNLNSREQELHQTHQKSTSTWLLSGSLLWVLSTIALIQVGHLHHCAGAEVAAVASSEQSTTLELGGLTFTASSDWKAKATPRPMSAGGFTHTSGKEEIDVDFYYFGEGQGGSLEQNLQRWKGQFEEKPEPKVEEITVGEKKFQLITLEGTFLSGSAFGPKTPVKNSKMLQAVVPGKGAFIFVRLVGDQEVVNAAQKDFIQLVSSSLR